MENKILNNVLKRFFAALGIDKVSIKSIDDTNIYGKVILKNQDTQNICWNYSKYKLPSETVLNILDLLRIKKLISIDKIIVNRNDLYNYYRTEYNDNLDFKKFETYLEELLSIEVNMIDSGETTDAFFIHE
jgi:hypothetical protein